MAAREKGTSKPAAITIIVKPPHTILYTLHNIQQYIQEYIQQCIQQYIQQYINTLHTTLLYSNIINSP